ncbi:hypothetical protein UFOVP174_19 [uncultured Caudovirales phage]|uniref:Uncharacterized protein n=1 Tax=uncultured Caudovirales phage TaxID=2100421 RepID=A0A6J7WI64_9CAUD|nr:hypothetical protein UFOVP174_19 [uncultured Caudovirales phage]
MTPKEKATELSNKYFEQFLAFGEYLSIEKANKCALIAVEEIIKYQDEFMNVVRYELPSNIVSIIPYKYWDEVKQEIEKL